MSNSSIAHQVYCDIILNHEGFIVIGYWLYILHLLIMFAASVEEKKVNGIIIWLNILVPLVLFWYFYSNLASSCIIHA